MNTSTDTEFAAFVGIDWADRKHDVCVRVAGSSKRELSVLPHLPEAIAQWAQGLRQRFGGRPIAVCLEIAKGPLVYALQRHPFLILFPVNPTTLAKYRETFCVSGAKDDLSDARLALDLLVTHPEKLTRLEPQSAPMRLLVQLVEQRRALFASFPSAGPVFAPRLLAAMGDQRSRYSSAAQLQQYAGIAPVTERSGHKSWVHWRWQCPKLLRQTFVE
jgi:hypothetical protein